MKFNIFVSYSTHDLPQVQALQKQIESTLIEIFIADYSIPLGAKLTSSIDKAIEQCDLFIVLWSKNAKNSDWVGQEIGKATTHKKKILPLVLEKGIKPSGFIAGLKYLSIFDSGDELKKAQEFIENEYNNKIGIQKNKNIITLMAIGSILLWAINQK